MNAIGFSLGIRCCCFSFWFYVATGLGWGYKYEDCLRMLCVPVCGFYGVSWGNSEGLLFGMMKAVDGCCVMAGVFVWWWVSSWYEAASCRSDIKL